jgi:thiamine phosphate synthase YjbQ (UPF0047 family)
MAGSGLVAVRERWPGGDARAGGIDFAVAVGRVRVRTTQAVSVLDLTARVEGFLRSAGLEAGWVNVQTCHTTTGLCLNENEPLLLRASETLNVAAGRLQLGRYQRVLLLEIDGPREREVSLLAMGEKRR